MPRGTQNITESVLRVQTLKDALRKVVAEIAAEKAAANKKAQETRPS